MSETETVPVAYTVLGWEPVRACGRCKALAIVQVEVAGVEFTLQGVSVVLGDDGRLTCQAPRFRHPRSGQWLPAIVLPEVLSQAIAAEVLDLPL
ncbi:MAG: hypothetical protein DI601_18375 [Azospirillum brasilense]|nr:MAG: hypothetical protein DI601_18375 [Azospirillum brasilense]